MTPRVVTHPHITTRPKTSKTLRFLRRFGALRATLLTGLLFVLCSAPSAHADVPLVTLEGDLPPEMRELVLDVLGEVDEAPRSRGQARRRGERARRQTLTVLRSQGYYGATIDFLVGQDGLSARRQDVSTLEPILRIQTGPQFRFSEVAVDLQNLSDQSKAALEPDLPLVTGEPALSADVISAELQLVRWLKAQGYPEAEALPRRAIVDHAEQTLSVTFNLSVGEKTRFGEIIQTGNANIDRDWLSLIAPFSEGDIYREERFNQLPQRVINTGAFGGAVARFDDKAVPQPDGSVTRDVILDVDAGKQNTISGEVGFSTTEGSGLDVTYERRNVAGRAETLTLSSSIKTNQFGLGVGYRIPYFMQFDRTLDLNGEIVREMTDAFSGERASGRFVATQQITPRINLGLGGGLEASQFEQAGTDVTAYLFEGLGQAVFDSRDDIFDAREGLYLEADAVPVYNFGEEQGFFTSVEADASAYQAVSDNLTVAGRLKLGSLFGADQDAVPINRRFFGGGGGSVRGFGFQSISPTDANGELIGGRSIAEASAELRYKGQGNLGAVLFLDAGSVGTSEGPSLSDVRYGAGIGLRYHTRFAPLRADIAIPLNKRPGDGDFQIYISIGQAF